MMRGAWFVILSAVAGLGLLSAGVWADTTPPLVPQNIGKTNMSGWSSKHSGKKFKKPSQVAQNVKYVCPVGDNYASDKPGKCPKCGVELKRVMVNSTRSVNAKTKHISNF